jgi:transposase-like protein
MEREILERYLADGLSLAEIGALVNRDPSTVGYWAKKHGLKPPRAEKFARRGPPDRRLVQTMAEEGATLSEIAAAIDRSLATVRYWLGKWQIDRVDARLSRLDPETAPTEAERLCKRHGLTAFILEARGYYRCKRCRQERVSAWRRRVKHRLVTEAGGRCSLCGYDRCVAALHFHHRDPEKKSFALSRQGVTRSFAEARAEAAKCVLLCANCHAEVETGYAEVDLVAA